MREGRRGAGKEGSREKYIAQSKQKNQTDATIQHIVICVCLTVHTVFKVYQFYDVQQYPIPFL